MKPFILVTIISLTALGGIAACPSPAMAHDFDDDAHCGYGHRGFGFGGGYGGGYGGGFGGGYGGYYGNGGHDMVPHWHQTTTPFGSFSWYGNGAHDFEPHAHTYTPYSYEGHSVSPFGYTRSIYPRYPNTMYAPW